MRNGFLRFVRKIGVREGEGRVVFFAALYFFVLLGSYFLLRPLREEFGVRGGLRNIPWLVLATLGGMLALNPVFGRLVSKLPRTRFIPLVYRFFLLNLVLFFIAWRALPDATVGIGRVFFVWLSVFNLFAVSVFRQLMADCWSVDQAKRLYGIIGAGGTFGAVCGSFLMTQIGRVESWLSVAPGSVVPFVFLASALGLELCVRIVGGLERAVAASPRLAVATPAAVAKRRLGGGAFEGMREVARSGFLLRICAYLFLAALLGTLLYYFQSRLVSEHAADATTRTQLFGWMNFGQQSLTLVTQIFATGAILATIGVGGALALLPILSLSGIGALWFAPLFLTIFVVQLLRRGLQFAVATPAMEALFSLIPRSQKYKAKAFIDTAVKRGGDVAGSALELGMGSSQRVGLFAMVAAIVGGLWLFVALDLGRAARKRQSTVQAT